MILVAISFVNDDEFENVIIEISFRLSGSDINDISLNESLNYYYKEYKVVPSCVCDLK